ncbi:Anaphase-promoting complex subunit 2 [Cladobotryum mycophilum]|uniref:Anaphase-promoting complex subunit 2 n=1 Tax=Cladobotryum mycophilum TaxID=491253 RepID=A0ABR0SGD8_9HYPO
MHELFDIVLHWPQSKGGLDDLCFAVTTPQRRLQLTDIFSATLQKRLLHPGRSTLDILQTYISMIRTFHALDHSKVLLDRVVPALKLCLWMRDDAIRIVVTGLLANHNSANPDENKGKLVELAVILNEASQQQRSHADDEDLDWNDMTWVPDPVDAGVNYKRPKNEDIIGTLISALGLQDVFIKEFQVIVAERLLSKQSGYQQEIKVLSLLKKRFGEAALQNCDVMIKDIMDSKRVDATLRRSIRTEGESNADVPSYHSKILSRLFWPSLPSDPFTVPRPVAEVQKKYEAGFEQLKSSRKLSWLDHLGSATVKLDFEDRSIELECKTYEAAIIYEFHDDGSGDAGPQQRHFNDLWEKLMIDEDLLGGALRFWVSKRVLRDLGNQTYAVLERLNEEKGTPEALDDEAHAQGAEQSGQPSPKKTKMDAKEKERRTIYWQFILGMLTNSSPAMPLGQIAMMMKMLIADGCPWSNEELQEFLGEKMADGELEFSGGKYRLPKK